MGSGLQALLLYLHPKKAGDDTDTPAATSGIGGMYTDSDSKVIGVFQDNYFANDKYRLKLMAGAADLNLDFYGIGGIETGGVFGYNLKAGIGFVQLLVRLPYLEHSYLGVRHLYADATVAFDLAFLLPPEHEIELPALNFNSTTSSLGLIYSYDSRNDSYYPTDGIDATVSFSADDEQWGSDYAFQRLSASYSQYFPLTSKHTLAIKAALSDVAGDPPFYMLTTLQMRGFATGRYLNDTSLSLHGEWRYTFAERWGTNIFVESGKIGESLGKLKDSHSVNSVGVGIRWQPISGKQLNLGIDAAKSTDDSAVYLRVGEAF